MSLLSLLAAAAAAAAAPCMAAAPVAVAGAGTARLFAYCRSSGSLGGPLLNPATAAAVICCWDWPPAPCVSSVRVTGGRGLPASATLLGGPPNALRSHIKAFSWRLQLATEIQA